MDEEQIKATCLKLGAVYEGSRAFPSGTWIVKIHQALKGRGSILRTIPIKTLEDLEQAIKERV